MANFKIGVNAKTFGDVLGGLLRVVNSKNALSILDNFKIELKESGEICIMASDIEHTATAEYMPTVSSGTGAVCINAKKLSDLIRKLEGDIYVGISDKYEVKIETATGKYSLQGFDTKDYPVNNDDAEVQAIELSTEDLLRGIGAVAYAVGTDDLFPQMKGIRMDIRPEAGDGKGHITFVSTDTRKMVKHTLSYNGMELPEKGVTISAKTANLVQTMLGKEPNITVAFSDKKAMFRNENIVVEGALIKGSYPDYNRVIPKESPIKATIDRMAFSKAISRVSQFAESGSNLIALQFGGLMGLTIESKDMTMATSGREVVPCEASQEITIGFNADYLLSVLSNLEGEQVEIGMLDASRPATVHGVGDDDTLALIMPMSLNV